MTTGLDPELPADPASSADLVTRLRAELADMKRTLHREQRRFESVFRHQFQFTALLAPDGCVLDYNEQWPVQPGAVPRDQVIGVPFWDTVWWADLPEIRATWPERLRQAAARGSVLLVEDRFVSSGGELRHASASVTAVHDEQGRLDYFVVQAADTTERWRAEELRRAFEERLRLTQPRTAAAAPAPRAGLSQHVAYVDDDDTMAVLAETLLMRAGYRVTVYPSAQALLDALSGAPAAFDAIVSDINMPGSSGLDLARTLALRAPTLPVILVSGYVTTPLASAATGVGARQLLRKEDFVDALCPAVDSALRVGATAPVAAP